jgi:hypothetical protein
VVTGAHERTEVLSKVYGNNHLRLVHMGRIIALDEFPGSN